MQLFNAIRTWRRLRRLLEEVRSLRGEMAALARATERIAGVLEREEARRHPTLQATEPGETRVTYADPSLIEQHLVIAAQLAQALGREPDEEEMEAEYRRRGIDLD